MLILEAGLPAAFGALVYRLIKVTEHHPEGAKTRDEMIICDLDWSPLGCSWERFVLNGHQIRYEYGQYDDQEFRKGRLIALS